MLHKKTVAVQSKYRHPTAADKFAGRCFGVYMDSIGKAELCSTNEVRSKPLPTSNPNSDEVGCVKV